MSSRTDTTRLIEAGVCCGGHRGIPPQMNTSDATPHIPSSDDVDPDVQGTPGGLADELEEGAEEREVVVGPDAAEANTDTG